MNDHQQVAAFILGKLRQATMIGDESELVTSSKQWLLMIQQGQLVITDPQKALEDKVPPDQKIPLKSVGNNEDKDESVHE